MMHLTKAGFFLVLFLGLSAGISAQAKKPKKPVKSGSPAVTAPVVKPTPEPSAEVPTKRNERPGVERTTDATGNSRNNGDPAAAGAPAYFYEFTRPGFTYSRILIEHDEAGRGKLSFSKDGSDEMISDPVNLSALTMGKINDALAALNFLDSNENYQYAKDYSHMGNVSLTVRKGGRERTVKYNWTENKNAKLLMDEYRRIGNEYTWRFEVMTARENFPLQTPGLMDALDSYLKRSEISDPDHLLPFLRPLSTDERLPLMARNRAVALIARIEKEKK